MTPMPRFGLKDWLLLLLVLGAAAGARVGYLLICAASITADPPLAVQDPPPAARVILKGEASPQPYDELRDLIKNLKEDRWGGSLAPLADVEERTAHTSPGYPWLLGMLARVFDAPDKFRGAVRWSQIGLGVLTAGLYFFFARRATRSVLVGTLAGLLCALHPFWVINTLEINDGVLATFLLAGCLFFGARAGQEGDALGSLLYGLALAGLALVRAALLPFAAVACLWFLLRCRTLPRGWLCALLAFLGFANGLAPWAVRNLQAFHEIVPVTDSMYLHLYMGVNSAATGGPQDEMTLRATLPPARLNELLAEKNQARRYASLGKDVLDQVTANPAGTLHKRLLAGQCFVFGQAWFREDGKLARREPGTELPAGIEDKYAGILEGTLLFMLLFGVLGWRWTYGWRQEMGPASLAVLWIPLPYLLSHAEALSGPRLPLDGILLCYAAFALACLLPGVGKRLLRRSPTSGLHMNQSDPLNIFLPPVREWFRSALGEPTAAQREGWPAIAAGRHTLILAPTGSGKTLAAFLACLDGLWRQEPLPRGVQVLYVSPLKALNNDIHRNLQLPLEGVAETARRLHHPLPQIEVAVRTGDTTTAERQRQARRPPHVLITTPESLHLLLTSRARETLHTVTHCVIDEIHALCPNKRGVFLALLLERLAELTPRGFVRIGLSATQRPLEEVARYLGGLEPTPY